MSGLAPLYGAASGLVISAALGWQYVAGYAVVAGPALGWAWARQTSPRAREGKLEEGNETSDAWQP